MQKCEYRRMYDLEHRYWWFLGKQLLVRKVLERYIVPDATGARMLDLGSGTGIILKLLKTAGPAYGLELAPEAIRFLKQRDLSNIVQADLNMPLPFEDCVFDAIFCLDVLEHVEKDLDLLNEMLRLCKTGGKVVITVPAFQSLWSNHDVALHHNRRYTRQDLLGKLRQTGFDLKILKTSYFNAILFFPILFIRRLKRTRGTTGPTRTDFELPIPAVFNRFLFRLYAFEIRCLSHITKLRSPLGASLMVIAEKVD